MTEINQNTDNNTVSLFYNPEFQKNWIKIGSNNRLFPWNPFVLANKSKLVSKFLDKVIEGGEMTDNHFYQLVPILENDKLFQEIWNQLNGVVKPRSVRDIESVEQVNSINTFLDYLEIENDFFIKSFNRKELSINDWKILKGIDGVYERGNGYWLCYKEGFLTKYKCIGRCKSICYEDGYCYAEHLETIDRGVWTEEKMGNGITSKDDVYEVYCSYYTEKAIKERQQKRRDENLRRRELKENLINLF